MTTLLDQDMTYGYCPIVKTEKTAEGLMVWGQAAGTGLDLDLQRFDKSYLARAVPDWFKWANVREQHSQIAAGVGKELEVSADGESYMLKALVVDPTTIKKVEAGVLKGFSPGVRRGKVVKSASAPNGLIVDGEMIEISLVDRPSDPTNKISICKAAGGGTLTPVDAEGHDVPLVKWLTADTYKSAQATMDDVLSGEYADAQPSDVAPIIGTLADLLIAEALMLKSADLTQPYDISGVVSAVNALEMFLDEEEEEAFEKFAHADITKRYFSTEEREEAEEKGHAMPGGKYPIENEEDLDNAIKLAGHGSAPESSIHEHIKKRARELGLSHKIPDTWKSANIGATEVDRLVKAAMAEVTKSYEARIEALMDEVAKVKATPIPGGPVLMARPVTPPIEKMGKADRLLSQAQNPALDPAIANLYLQAAKQQEGAQAS
jgi:hypothetical protein